MIGLRRTTFARAIIEMWRYELKNRHGKTS